ncbi:MAG: cysteine desulfurase family protein [Pseudomonadota bacterium]
MSRVYLDWNATTPLRVEARDAMLAAMDMLGNPSSVHAEGRAARSLIERAREDIGNIVGVDRTEVIFTSGATEAANLACAGRDMACADFEHDAVFAHQSTSLAANANGALEFDELKADLLAVQTSNSETGVLQNNIAYAQRAWAADAMVLVDAVQNAGKFGTNLGDLGADFMILSAHKLGGPKGVGALCLKLGVEVNAQIQGGGQEEGRRSGTENILGIAGFAAAYKAAEIDRKNGAWDALYDLRNMLEAQIAEIAPDAIFIGKDAPRLTNTSCFAVPGWKGETQVMQMDLAGFAISAGSACSSGKVKQSRVLKAMGFDDITASSAIRVSLGPDNTTEDVMRFTESWGAAYKRFKAKAA